jgi:hypothetical protein
MSAGPSLYNPRDISPEQLDALLTGRTTLLEEILDNLRAQARGKTRQHWLLRGQRGMGKTHLAGVIYHRVKTDPTLNATYLPLWLGEADTYEVYSSATLLEIIGKRLAEEEKDGQLLERLEEVEGVGDEDEFFQAMVELLSEESERRQRVLLVLVENLDALLESFAPKDRKEQTRQFRALLLHNPHFLFISTTPTRYLSGLEDPKEPLYAHLKERDLDHLTEPETQELLRKLAQSYPREAVDSFIDGDDGRLRLRVIHRLTGGLPRSIIMAFTTIREASGIGSLVQEMRTVLDTQTAYFEARLARLPPRERKIVTTMALAPTNLTIREIAQQSRLPARSIPPLLERLEKDGHVRPAPGTGRRDSVYELCEGLFRIWYQYRKGRPVLEPLVDFLAYWYRVEELEHVVGNLKYAADAPSASLADRLALLQAEEALRLARSEEWRRTREQFWAECKAAVMVGAVSPSATPQATIALSTLLQPVLDCLTHQESVEHGRVILRRILDTDLQDDKKLIDILRRIENDILPKAAALNSGAMFFMLSTLIGVLGDDPRSSIQEELLGLMLKTAFLNLTADTLSDASVSWESMLPTLTEAEPHTRTIVSLLYAFRCLDLRKNQQAILHFEEFLAQKDSLSKKYMQASTLFACQMLLSLYHKANDMSRYMEITYRMATDFEALEKEPFRRWVADAKAQLVIFSLIFKTDFFAERLEQWDRVYGHIDMPEYHQIRGRIRLVAAITHAREHSLFSQEMINQWVKAAVSGKITNHKDFWRLAVNLFITFDPGQMQAWLTHLSKAPMESEDRALLSWHLMAAEVLLQEEQTPEDGAKSGSARARIPPELRPQVEALVEQIRALRAQAVS